MYKTLDQVKAETAAQRKKTEAKLKRQREERQLAYKKGLPKYAVMLQYRLIPKECETMTIGNGALLIEKEGKITRVHYMGEKVMACKTQYNVLDYCPGKEWEAELRTWYLAVEEQIIDERLEKSRLENLEAAIDKKRCSAPAHCG